VTPGGETAAPSRPAGCPASSHREDGMAGWLPGRFLPLLLLARLPAGESPRAVASALNASLSAYACRRVGTWLLLLLFPVLWQHFTPTSAPAPCHVPGRGVPPCDCLCPGYRLCPWGPNSRLRGFERASPSAAGRENSRGGEGNRGAYKPDDCEGGQLLVERADIP